MSTERDGMTNQEYLDWFRANPPKNLSPEERAKIEGELKASPLRTHNSIFGKRKGER